MDRLYIDFETRSHSVLGTEGTVRYANHPTTEVIAIGFAHTTGISGCITVDEIRRWRKGERVKSILNLRALIKLSDCVVGHNAFFEIYIWRTLLEDVLGPCPAVEKWRCTMNKVRFYGLPPALKLAAVALKLDNEKDDEGYAVMMAMCQPNKFSGEYTETPDMWRKLYKYCTQDCIVSMSIDEFLLDLPEQAERLWQVTMHVNLRGIKVNLLLCERAIELADKLRSPAINAFKEKIGVSPTQGKKLLERLQLLVDIKSLQKEEVKRVCEDPDTPQIVKDLLHERSLVVKAAIAKFKKTLSINWEGRVYNSLIAYGAHTHRFTSQDLQTQNFKRPGDDVDMEQLVKRIIALDLTLTLDDISKAVRGILCGDMSVVDYSQMEARIAAWVADDEPNLREFRAGRDIYLGEASSLYGRTITAEEKTERGHGKIQSLASQYGGGIGATVKMAGQSKVNLETLLPLWDTATPEEKEKAHKTYEWCVKYKKLKVRKDIGLVCDVAKQRWRLAHPNIVSYWKKLQDAFEAVLLDESMSTVAEVKSTYGVVKIFRYSIFTVMKLPSGTCRFYPYMYAKPTTEKEREEGELGDYTFRYYRVKDKKFEKTYTYGGKLFENLVQDIMSDCFNDAFIAAHEAGLELFLGVHDEIAAYGFVQDKLEKVMLEASNRWSDGLPVGVDGYESTVYKK